MSEVEQMAPEGAEQRGCRAICAVYGFHAVAQAELRQAARALLRARLATATGAGMGRLTNEARAWDRFALALDAAEDAVSADQIARTDERGR